jgi:hypothetical protein
MRCVCILSMRRRTAAYFFSSDCRKACVGWAVNTSSTRWLHRAWQGGGKCRVRCVWRGKEEVEQHGLVEHGVLMMAVGVDMCCARWWCAGQRLLGC